VASTSAKINVIVDGLKQVQALERSLSNITSLTGKINGISKAPAIENKVAKLKEAQRASMARTRSIGDQIQKAEDQGLNVAKARRAINRAALADSRGQLQLSEQQAKSALRELNFERSTTKELRLQNQLKKIGIARGGGFVGGRKGGRGGGANPLTSGLISGAFPLLFGQGLAGGAAGFAGGSIGTLIGGQMGGFAGGLVATAALQTIQDQLVTLGQALNPLTADITRLSKAIGIVGTAEARRLQVIEELAGKEKALEIATQQLTNQIGGAGVQALKTFGEDVQTLGNEFSKLFTAMGASLATFINNSGALKAFINFISNRNLMNQARKSEDTNIQNLLNKRSDLITQQQNLQFSSGPLPFEGTSSLGIPSSGATPEQKQKILDLDEKIKDVTKEILQLQREINAENTLTITTSGSLFQSNLNNLKEETNFLQDKLNLGSNMAEVNKLELAIREKLQDESFKFTEDQKLQLVNAKKLNDELNQQFKTQQQIKSVLATGIENAIQGLITGAKSLSEVLSNVAAQLASIFLRQAIFSFIPGLRTQAEGGYNRAGSFKAFQYGGVVSSPTLGMIGEGGEPEYVIPSSKMDGAMARYSAGARGGAVIPGGSGASGTVAGSSGNTIVEYTGPVLNFNGDEYVPKDSVPQIINAAAKQGATLGQSRTLNTLKNSRSSRAKIGI